ncbi:hypothetical protein ACTSKR_08500 [Chitinibacteraceae bacterium HSL-7]
MSRKDGVLEFVLNLGEHTAAVLAGLNEWEQRELAEFFQLESYSLSAASTDPVALLIHRVELTDSWRRLLESNCVGERVPEASKASLVKALTASISPQELKGSRRG